MVNTTEYPSKDKTPDLAVKQVFVKTLLPQALRLKAAEAGLLDPDAWAAASDTLEGFKKNVERIFTREVLGEGDTEVETARIPQAAAWRKCKALAEARDSRRSRLEEDAHRSPRWPMPNTGKCTLTSQSHTQTWCSWVTTSRIRSS